MYQVFMLALVLTSTGLRHFLHALFSPSSISVSSPIFVFIVGMLQSISTQIDLGPFYAYLATNHGNRAIHCLACHTHERSCDFMLLVKQQQLFPDLLYSILCLTQNQRWNQILMYTSASLPSCIVPSFTNLGTLLEDGFGGT